MTDVARILPAFTLVLLSLLFFGCEETTATTESPAATRPAGQANATSGLNIVFIKVDSLQSGYTEVASELERLETNFVKAQENHTKRVAALQREFTALQNKVQQGLLAPNQIQAEQQRMANKEQEIVQQRDIALNSIQEDQMRIQQRFSERVKAILEELQAENGYDYILNQGQNSAVLITNDAYDITPMVLERLNNAAPLSDTTAVE